MVRQPAGRYNTELGHEGGSNGIPDLAGCDAGHIEVKMNGDDTIRDICVLPSAIICLHEIELPEGTRRVTLSDIYGIFSVPED